MPILKQALQPTAAQEAALNNLERAFDRAAGGLNAVRALASDRGKARHNLGCGANDPGRRCPVSKTIERPTMGAV
jgi:hypothetical protein